MSKFNSIFEAAISESNEYATVSSPAPASSAEDASAVSPLFSNDPNSPGTAAVTERKESLAFRMFGTPGRFTPGRPAPPPPRGRNDCSGLSSVVETSYEKMPSTPSTVGQHVPERDDVRRRYTFEDSSIAGVAAVELDMNNSIKDGVVKTRKSSNSKAEKKWLTKLIPKGVRKGTARRRGSSVGDDLSDGTGTGSEYESGHESGREVTTGRGRSLFGRRNKAGKVAAQTDAEAAEAAAWFAAAAAHRGAPKAKEPEKPIFIDGEWVLPSETGEPQIYVTLSEQQQQRNDQLAAQRFMSDTGIASALYCQTSDTAAEAHSIGNNIYETIDGDVLGTAPDPRTPPPHGLEEQMKRNVELLIMQSGRTPSISSPTAAAEQRADITDNHIADDNAKADATPRGTRALPPPPPLLSLSMLSPRSDADALIYRVSSHRSAYLSELSRHGEVQAAGGHSPACSKPTGDGYVQSLHGSYLHYPSQMMSMLLPFVGISWWRHHPRSLPRPNQRLLVTVLQRPPKWLGRRQKNFVGL